MVTRNKDMDIGVIHKSKEGFQIQVIEYKSWSNVVVKFLDFDVEVRSNSSDIRLGKVEKPRGKRKETNISYGNFDSLGVDTLNNAGIPTCIASVWRSMICRCYNKNHYNYKYYGMLSVTVCTEWHSYENFHSWYVKNYPKDGGSYCLDKDLLSTGSKEYSPEKCTFITREENSKLAGI